MLTKAIELALPTRAATARRAYHRADAVGAIVLALLDMCGPAVDDALAKENKGPRSRHTKVYMLGQRSVWCTAPAIG